MNTRKFKLVFAAILAAGIIYIAFNILMSNSMVDISFRSFEMMIRSNDVQKVVLVKNQDFIEITLKPEALSNAKYAIQLEQNKSLLGSNTGPHYKVEIVSTEVFARHWDELMDDVPEDLPFRDTFNPRAFDQVKGQGLDKVPHKQRAKPGLKRRMEQKLPRNRVIQSGLHAHIAHRHHQDLEGNEIPSDK